MNVILNPQTQRASYVMSFGGDFRENWPRYNGAALYNVYTVRRESYTSYIWYWVDDEKYILLRR